MSNHVSYDAASPKPDGVPGTDTVLLYCGGDTPHVWTNAEIAEQPERFRVPVWVRSNLGGTAIDDANAFVEWLTEHNVPKGVCTVLDLETLVNVAYVNVFGNILHTAGYKVLPYGSGSTLFKNPELDGYFLADPDATEIDPRCVATQYGYYGSYDLSWIGELVPLWDTQPVPVPTPTPPVTVQPPVAVPGMENMMNVDFSCTTGADGTAYVLVPIPDGCTHMVGGAADVTYAYGNPPHHDLDINQSATSGPNDASGVVVQPVVTNNPEGKQYARLAGGAANHYYTGHVQFV